MAKYLQKDLVVYTGVHNRLKLKDTGDDGRQKMMFLCASSNNDESIAIPLYFWKLVYEPESKRGVVYVTLNNPYVDPTTEDYHVCEKPMFSKDGALMPKQWKPRNVAQGYSYMCEVPDFIRNNEILLHDFSAAMVTDLLYVTRKPGDESVDGKKKA
ncbi:uncharacterized protein LOC116738454 [Nasonia vitripennis]|uniref:DNA/RNA non-specific endonuclease/pyrophosphatase/phosphodiesterase domain-containing protein n=1 Tax=Nasonia vitripennis TaxID=7425 RepID=A0A7M7QQY5_NASVI|nr:uncharacterized protein LOC116738454 [Nasonia vitripennis]